MNSARGVRNGCEAIGSNSMKITFNARAAESGKVVAAFLALPEDALQVAAEPPPTAEPLAAEPPMTAAKPLSLLQ